MAKYPRTRQKLVYFNGHAINGQVVQYPQYPKEIMTEQSARPTNVVHRKIIPATGFWTTFNGDEYTIYNLDLLAGIPATVIPGVAEYLGSFDTALKRSKLTTTNEFGMIQFFAELDDSMSLFTRNFWRSLSYGSFTWGVLPFVSEAKKLLKFLSKSHKSFEQGPQRYEDTSTRTFTLQNYAIPLGGIGTLTAEITLRKSGVITYPPSSQAQQWLDRLGIHPDINVAWDLLPLSFMVDYFLPIGDYIKSIHQSGWIREVAFTGWITTQVNLTWTQTGHIYNTPSGTCVCKHENFSRVRIASNLSIQDAPRPTLESIPNHFANSENKLTNGFNTVYLLKSGRTR